MNNKATCGFRLTAENVAMLTDARPVDSGVGWSYTVTKLQDQYQKMGLKVEMGPNPDVPDQLVVFLARCRICGLFDKSNVEHDDGHYMLCDQQKHADYYDSLGRK